MELDTISELNSSKSSNRRRAAKKIRKIKDSSKCEMLLVALEIEITKNTWETQYQMIMAIGETKCNNSLEFLYSILKLKLEPMVRIAIADAITRMEQTNSFLIFAMESKDNELIEGSIRALALEHKILSKSIILKLIDYLESINNSNIIFWLAAGAPGWDQTEIKKHLIKWTMSQNIELSRAAFAALDKKYLNWSIL